MPHTIIERVEGGWTRFEISLFECGGREVRMSDGS